MDQRHTEIREGAGLEESRINREFVEWLQRWGGWILIVFAGIALAYAGLQKLEQMKREARDTAFIALNDALDSQNPEGLIRIAEEHDVGVVPHMARLAAADIWLECARLGLSPGDLYEVRAQGNWGGEIPETSQDFDPDQALRRAADLYEQVHRATRTKAHRELAVGALFGLAAVAETRGDMEAAAGHLRAADELAEDAGFADLAAAADKRLESLEGLQMASLPKADQLYQPLGEEPVEQPDVSAPPLTPIPAPEQGEVEIPTPSLPDVAPAPPAPTEDTAAPPADEPEGSAPPADEGGDGGDEPDAAANP